MTNDSPLDKKVIVLNRKRLFLEEENDDGGSSSSTTTTPYVPKFTIYNVNASHSFDPESVPEPKAHPVWQEDLSKPFSIWPAQP